MLDLRTVQRHKRLICLCQVTQDSFGNDLVLLAAHCSVNVLGNLRWPSRGQSDPERRLLPLLPKWAFDVASV